VGLALEERFGDRRDEEAALLSLHFGEAGDHARTWHYASIAGMRAAETYANVVAAELIERGCGRARAGTARGDGRAGRDPRGRV
jgi:predicted ATPase